jgi:hypothetical protein
MKIKYLILCIIGALVLLSFTIVEYITPDDYPVTNEMLASFHGKKDIDGIFSFDKAWFKNDELNEVLIFELYTDYHRLAIYHCKSDFLFEDWLKNIELHRKVHNSNYDLADESKKQQVFKKFFDNAQEIDKTNFKTNQGLKLGLDKNEVLKKYRSPYKNTKIDNIEKIEWVYQGEYSFTEMGQEPTGILAQESWGYEMTMYFENDKLIGIIIKNDIP